MKTSMGQKGLLKGCRFRLRWQERKKIFYLVAILLIAQHCQFMRNTDIFLNEASTHFSGFFIKLVLLFLIEVLLNDFDSLKLFKDVSIQTDSLVYALLSH